MHRVRDATEVARSAAHNPSTSRIESETDLNPSRLQKKVGSPQVLPQMGPGSRLHAIPSLENWSIGAWLSMQEPTLVGSCVRSLVALGCPAHKVAGSGGRGIRVPAR